MQALPVQSVCKDALDFQKAWDDLFCETTVAELLSIKLHLVVELPERRSTKCRKMTKQDFEAEHKEVVDIFLFPKRLLDWSTFRNVPNDRKVICQSVEIQQPPPKK